MASLKYRCISPGAKTVMYPVGASQKFYHECVTFVTVAGGYLFPATSTSSTLYGGCIAPAGVGANSSSDTTYWQSASTSGVDELPVYVEEGTQFLVPASTTVTAAMQAGAWDIFINASTTCMTVDVTASDVDVLIVDQIGTDVQNGASTDAVVHINPLLFQAA